MTEPVAQLQDLSKSYGSVRALDGLACVIRPGPVGLLGPNGAGKTTLIKLLLGLLRPDRGQAWVLGLDPTSRAGSLGVRRRVGYMPEGDCLVPGMTAVELVTTMGRLAGMSYRDGITRAHEVLDYVGLEEARYRGLDEYSTGMKQRLKLAQALVHDPPLLLLDEPTNGLDPKGRRHMLELVHDLGHAQGKSLLVCSHLLPDVERTCDDVVVLHRGRLLAEGAIAELTASRGAWVQVELAADVPGANGGEADLGAAVDAALARAGLAFERRSASAVSAAYRVEVPGDGSADRLFALAAEAGAVVTRLSAERSTLEDVFLGALDRSAEAQER
jgi:ABC-2 type transport system ATP-binding protein